MKQDSAIRKAAEIGAEKLLEYFSAPKDQRDAEAATLGVKAGGNYARIYAAETNRLAVGVTAAKMMGKSGEALVPLLEEIAERPLLIADAGERSGGDRPAAA